LLGVPQAQVRSYIRAGLISCDRDQTGNYRLSFQDLVVLRVAAKLLAGSARRVHTALRAARDQIGNDRGLSELKISAHGRRVVSGRGSVFWRCARSERDPSFPKYPRLPVLRCAGHEPSAEPERGSNR